MLLAWLQKILLTEGFTHHPQEHAVRQYAACFFLTAVLNLCRSTGAKPWECGTCHATFGDQSSCARHIREQHSGETHVCPHCNSTYGFMTFLWRRRVLIRLHCSNKRASDFIHHMLASHNIEKTSVDLEKCRKLVDVSEKTPRLTPPGMPVRRSHPPSRARGVLPKRNEPVVVISGSEHEGAETLFIVNARKS